MINQATLKNKILNLLHFFVEDRSDCNFDYDKNASQEAVRMMAILNYIDEISVLKNRKIKILEIGLGYAMVTTSISLNYNERQVEIYATEHPNREILSNKNLIDILKSTRTTVEKIDITLFPWKLQEEEFDVIVFSETAEHIEPTKLPKIFEQISSKLKVGGYVILSTPNLVTWRNRSRLLRGKSIFDAATPLDWAGGTYAHIRLYTPDEIKHLAQTYNLFEYKRRYFDFGLINKSFNKKILYKLLYKAFPALSPDFFIILSRVK